MSPGTRRVWTGVGALLGTVALLIVGATVVVEQSVNAALLADVMNRAVSPATDGRYRIEVDHVDVSPWTGTLAVQGIRLRPADFGSEEISRGGRALRFSGDLTGISIEGVHLWRLLRHRDLEARSFRVDAPRLGLIVAQRDVPDVRVGGVGESIDVSGSEGPGGGLAEAAPPAGRAAADAPGSQASEPDTRHEAVARTLPYIRVDDVSIRDVNVTLVTLRSGEGGQTRAPLTEQLRGLSVTFDDLHIDPNRPAGSDRFLFSRDVRLSLEGLALSTPRGERIDVGPVTASSADERFRFERVALVPGQSREEFLAGQGPDGDRVSLSVGPVTVSGLDWWRLLEDLDAVAEEVSIDSLSIDILSDKHRPSTPSTGPPSMPHDIIRELPVGLSVDEVVIRGGSVTYSERGPRSSRPGSVTFAAIDARISNLTNDPDRVAAGGPTMVEANARLFGSASMRVRASLPLLGPPPTMFFFAEIGGFDAGAVNAILPDLEGLRVTDGTVDSARVDIRYGPAGATGGVMVGYRDLSIRQEDRVTGEQNLGQKLTSFLANTFVIRGSNQPDDGRGPRVGEVDYVLPADAPFFKVFWEAIRGGLIDVAKR